MKDSCVLCSGKEAVGAETEMVICSNCVHKIMPLKNEELQKLVDALRRKKRNEAADWIENRFFNEEEGIEDGTVGETRGLYCRRNTTRTLRSDKRRAFGAPNKKGLTIHSVG